MSALALLGGAMVAWPAAAQEHAAPHDPHAGHGAPASANPEHCTITLEGEGDRPCLPHAAAQSDDGHAGRAASAAPAFAEASGTARVPGNEGMMDGLHLAQGAWMVMAHGYVQASHTDHSGPRGDALSYVTSMGMVTAETRPDWGRVQLKSMFSLEPLMDARGYPNLFATGETANGEPLVDRQHPHDLFMELAARVDVSVGAGSTLFLYGGPVGEPALGPAAFMHRGSAALNPEPPIAHHWFDSTHITYGVVTAGWSSPLVQIEASAFRGREPDEERWDIETPRLDSWALRGMLTPSPAWTLQASYGELRSPEASHPDEDERRFTASAHYSNGPLSGILAYSSKRHVERHGGGAGHAEEPALDAWIAEASWAVTGADTLFGRFEAVTNDELFPDHDHPLHDRRFRVAKVQLGYARSFDLGATRLALGASGALYAKPRALDPYYGSNPFGLTVFARLSLGD